MAKELNDIFDSLNDERMQQKALEYGEFFNYW